MHRHEEEEDEEDATVIELEDVGLLQHDLLINEHTDEEDTEVEVIPIDELSDDVLCHIVSFISRKSELLNLSKVDRRFYSCSNDESLWKIAMSCKDEKRKLKNFNMLYQETTRFDSSQLPIVFKFRDKHEYIEYKKKRWRHMDGIEQSYRANDEVREMTKGVNVFTQFLIILVTCAIPMIIAGVFVIYGLFADNIINQEEWTTVMVILTCIGIIFNIVIVFLCSLHFGFIPCGISLLLAFMARNSIRNLSLERFRMIFFRDGVDPLANFHCLFWYVCCILFLLDY
jgi:hypothetical protein